MKKQVLMLWIAAFLLCINAVYAVTLVGSGWYYSGETIKVENRAYSFLMTNETVTVDYTTGFLNLQNNTCDIVDHVRFCVDNIEYSIQTDLIRADMNIYTLKPTITLTREIEDAEILVKQEVEITVTITNSGGAQATNVVFTDTFPSELEITETEIVKKEGNSVKWTGTINPSGTETFTYKIKAKDEIEANLKGKLSYYDGFETKTIYSSALGIKATPFLTLTPAFGRATVYAGEITNYSVNISNIYYWNASQRLKVDILELIIDKGLEITDRPSTIKKVSENIYHWSDYVLSNNSKTVFIKIKGTIVPGGSIYAKAYYTDPDGIARETKQYKTTITVQEKGVIVSSNIEDLTLEAYEKKRMKIWLQNKNPYADLKNVIVNLSSNFIYLPNLRYNTLPAHDRYTLVDKTIYGLAVSSSTSYKLDVNVSYQTEFGDNDSTTYTTTFTVEPINDLDISQTISPASIEKGETSEVTVTVKNNRRTKVKNVYIKDNFSEDLKVTGITSKRMEINDKTTVTPYTYTITGPAVINSTTYSINTTVYYDDELINATYHETIRRSYSGVSTLTVKPRTMTLTVTREISETSPRKGEIIDVDYTIANPSTDQTAKNIVIHFPLSQNFDFVGEKTTFEIDTLAPGETFNIYGKEKIRSKYNGTALKIPKTRVTFFNEDGASFDSNSTEQTKTFGYQYTEGPYIIAEVNCSDEVNDTNMFDVKVTLRNIGTDYATVTATDDVNDWKVSLSPNSEKTFTYKKIIPTPGTYDLTQVGAHYSYKNSSFITGSNTKRVTVVSKPLIEIKKITPEKANNMDSFTVTLNIKNVENIALKNVNITDDGNQWLIKSLENETNISYQKRIKETGNATLPQANITYSYLSHNYSTNSNAPNLEILKKEVITAKKEARGDVNQSQPFPVSLTITNLEEKQLSSVRIVDNEQEWIINLAPKEQKTLQYNITFGEVEEKTLQAATVYYKYNEEDYEIKSNTKTIRVREYTPPKPKKIEEKPEELIAQIFWYIKKVLTWRRG